MQALLAYDPARVRALALRTAAAIRWLDARNSTEPLAEDAIATLRTIPHTLSTIWMPWFSSVLGDTSMTDWDDVGPAAAVPAARGFAGGPQNLSADEIGQIADQMADLAEGIESGDLDALVELNDLMAEHGDNRAVMAEFARQMGPEGFEAFVTLLASGEVFPLGGIAWAQYMEARDGVLAVLLPTPLNLAADPDFDLSEAITVCDEAAWFNAINPLCVDLAGPAADYRGGGFITGPDGRQHPIVVPWVQEGENQYTAEIGLTATGVPNLNGEDDGWTPVGYQSGVERFQESPSWAERTLGFLAGTTGAVTALPPSDGLQFIQMRPDSLPFLAAAPAGSPPPVGSSEPEMTDTVEGTPTAQAVIDFTVRGSDGWVFATNMDNQRERAYQVIYEQNEDGRIRARIETFTLAQDANGDVVIVPEHVWVNSQGGLMSELITYAPPDGATGVWSNVSSVAFAPGTTPVAYEVPGQSFP